MQRNYAIEQPERFVRSVKASCGPGCPYPNCTCREIPQEIADAINAWEALPDEPVTNGNRNNG